MFFDPQMLSGLGANQVGNVQGNHQVQSSEILPEGGAFSILLAQNLAENTLVKNNIAGNSQHTSSVSRGADNSKTELAILPVVSQGESQDLDIASSEVQLVSQSTGGLQIQLPVTENLNLNEQGLSEGMSKTASQMTDQAVPQNATENSATPASINNLSAGLIEQKTNTLFPQNPAIEKQVFENIAGLTNNENTPLVTKTITESSVSQSDTRNQLSQLIEVDSLQATEKNIPVQKDNIPTTFIKDSVEPRNVQQVLTGTNLENIKESISPSLLSQNSTDEGVLRANVTANNLSSLVAQEKNQIDLKQNIPAHFIKDQPVYTDRSENTNIFSANITNNIDKAELLQQLTAQPNSENSQLAAALSDQNAPVRNFPVSQNSQPQSNPNASFKTDVQASNLVDQQVIIPPAEGKQVTSNQLKTTTSQSTINAATVKVEFADVTSIPAEETVKATDSKVESESPENSKLKLDLTVLKSSKNAGRPVISQQNTVQSQLISNEVKITSEAKVVANQHQPAIVTQLGQETPLPASFTIRKPIQGQHAGAARIKKGSLAKLEALRSGEIEQNPTLNKTDQFVPPAGANEFQFSQTKDETNKPSEFDLMQTPPAVESVDSNLPEAEIRASVHHNATEKTATTQVGQTTTSGRASFSSRWIEMMQRRSPGQPISKDGWQSLKIQLPKSEGEMMIKTRRENEKVAVTVGFSDPNVQSAAQENMHRIEMALQEQYQAEVDLTFMDQNMNSNDQSLSDFERSGNTRQNQHSLESDLHNQSLTDADQKERKYAGQYVWVG